MRKINCRLTRPKHENKLTTATTKSCEAKGKNSFSFAHFFRMFESLCCCIFPRNILSAIAVTIASLFSVRAHHNVGLYEVVKNLYLNCFWLFEGVAGSCNSCCSLSRYLFDQIQYRACFKFYKLKTSLRASKIYKVKRSI